VDETGLYWKKMPSRTFISREEKHAPGYKPDKDRLTLLLLENASETVKLKPLLVHHSETPRVVMGLLKAILPVIWTSNRRAWVTQDIFTNLYTDYFCPTVHRYYDENNHARRALLLLNSALGHPPNTGKIRTAVDVMVEYRPPNTIFLWQPMDKGVIENF
jgi:hypothetical protein